MENLIVKHAALHTYTFIVNKKITYIFEKFVFNIA